MIWTTGINVNYFNVLKAIAVFIIIKPLTLYLTSALSNHLSTVILNKHGAVHINSLGPFGAWFDGFLVARPEPRQKRFAMVLAPMLLLTVWIGTVAEVVFEFGVNAVSKDRITSALVNTTSGRSDTIFYTGGRDKTTDRIARLEMSCQEANTLSTLVDVYTVGTKYLCGADKFRRTVCASGYNLLGRACTPPVLQTAVGSAGVGWTSETWMKLLLITSNWTFSTDGSPADNGFVTFIPDAAYHAKKNRGQLFSLTYAADAVPFVGLEAVHCGSGSSLNRTGNTLPGLRPFQICMWEFKSAVVLTNADWLTRSMRSKELPGVSGVSNGSESVRGILAAVAKFQLSTIGRWTSMEKREQLSSRDIMTTLGLLRGLFSFSVEDCYQHQADTYEVGMWATGSMALRLAERAVTFGMGFQNGSKLVERKVVNGTRQIATVDLRLLALYVGCILLFGMVMALICATNKSLFPVDLSLETMLGWWALEQNEDQVCDLKPRAHTLRLVRDKSSDGRLTAVI